AIVRQLSGWRAVFVIRAGTAAERGGLLRSAPRGISTDRSTGAARSEDPHAPPSNGNAWCSRRECCPWSAAPSRDCLGHESFENLSDARGHALEGSGAGAILFGRPVVRAPEQQPARGGIGRCRDLVGQTAEP